MWGQCLAQVVALPGGTQRVVPTPGEDKPPACAAECCLTE